MLGTNIVMIVLRNQWADFLEDLGVYQRVRTSCRGLCGLPYVDPPILRLLRESARDLSSAFINDVKTMRQLLTKNEACACFRKKDIPATAKYVLQGQFRFEGRPRDTFPFFCFSRARDVINFFHVYANMQLSRKFNGVFVMECTRPAECKKWVIDLDGDLKELAANHLIARADYCTEDECAYVEHLAVEYAACKVRSLAQCGFIAKDTRVYLAVCRRHRKSEKHPGCLKKLSMHITLGVMATHKQWLDGMGAASKHMREFAVGEIGKIACIDDGHIANNSAGQNMSILYASKPVNVGETRQPLFSFADLFIVDLKNEGNVEKVGSEWTHFFEKGVVRNAHYRLSSMLLTCGIEVIATASGVAPGKVPGPRKRTPVERGEKVEYNKEKQKVARKTYTKAEVDDDIGKEMIMVNSVSVHDFPSFAREILITDGVTTFNDQMPSLFSSFPPSIQNEHRNPVNVKMVKVEQPRLCVRFLLGAPRKVHKHEQNGSVVSLMRFCRRLVEVIVVVRRCVCINLHLNYIRSSVGYLSSVSSACKRVEPRVWITGGRSAHGVRGWSRKGTVHGGKFLLAIWSSCTKPLLRMGFPKSTATTFYEARTTLPYASGGGLTVHF